MPSAAGEPRRLTFDGRMISGLAWTPEGDEVVFSSNREGGRRLWRIPTRNSHAGDEPQPFPGIGRTLRDPSISLQGNRLAYSQRLADTNIWRIQVAGPKAPTHGRTKLISSTRTDSNPQYSPDGKRIAFTSLRTGNHEIWMCDSDGSNPVQLTFSDGPPVGSPRWSPDGQRIAFDSYREGNGDIYTVRVDGGSPRRLTTDPSEESLPNWSRDGRWIYFSSERSGEHEVWKMPPEGGQALRVTKNGGWVALTSPDGKFLFFTGKRGHGRSLWKIPVEGGEDTLVFESLEAPRDPHWAVSDQGIYFVSAEAAETRPSIKFFRFATRRVTQIAVIEGQRQLGPNLSVSPDGHWILYAQRDQHGSDRQQNCRSPSKQQTSNPDDGRSRN